jgi:pseudouridine-5'-phosphate glycosidase
VSPVLVSTEVAEAVAERRPVVALESTIIAHGLPRPRNLAVAMELEGRLRDRGVIPATVGVIDGVAMVGLSQGQIENLATRDDVVKASVRDLPAVVATGRYAATTVAATAFLARRAGIRVFATGGLGGVHRGASATFDESADLPTLSATSITVVCAGVKSILDVGATLERFETLGITVVGYRTERFPGFYVADSGFSLDTAVQGPYEVAQMMAAADQLGCPGALIVANPVPAGSQLDPALHRAALAESLAAAERDGIKGKAVTPYLLDRLQRITGGASLEANVAAVINNVAVAGDVATAWSTIQSTG